MSPQCGTLTVTVDGGDDGDGGDGRAPGDGGLSREQKIAIAGGLGVLGIGGVALLGAGDDRSRQRSGPERPRR